MTRIDNTADAGDTMRKVNEAAGVAPKYYIDTRRRMIPHDGEPPLYVRTISGKEYVVTKVGDMYFRGTKSGASLDEVMVGAE